MATLVRTEAMKNGENSTDRIEFYTTNGRQG